MLKPQSENCASWTADCMETEMPDPMPKPIVQTTGSNGSMPAPGDDVPGHYPPGS